VEVKLNTLIQGYSKDYLIVGLGPPNCCLPALQNIRVCLATIIALTPAVSLSPQVSMLTRDRIEREYNTAPSWWGGVKTRDG